ncbi:unnamed protein product [Meloidogyne enterolobii]|uniref:Uncharacterized protein n=1 Tax=Meloidogyne enterolobii TaxID=390850 RepID=A0ACB1AU41_MELEN
MVESDRSNVCMFHLRRVQFQTYVKEKGCQINDAIEPSLEPAILGRSTMILLDKQTKIGRNPELVDVVLHSVVHSNMISRDHSEIIGVTDDKGKYVRYLITDRSLNGTYVNDTRVNIQQQLKEGDLIKFGHVNGAAIKAGEYAPQQSAEFIFRFERALSNYNYFGYSKKRVRVQSDQKRAYMQINSDLVVPTEVYSCVAVPKALPPSSGTVSGPSASSMNATVPASTVPVAPDSTTNNSGAPVVVVPPTVLSTPSSISATIPVTCNISHNGINGFTGTNSLPNSAQIQNNASTQQNHQQQQLAHLAAFAAATTAVTNAQQQHSSSTANSLGGTTSTLNNSQQRNQQITTNNNHHHQQQQQALNALNQLGLGTVTAATNEEQINAQLRSLMASHDAMSAMERLTAQQQFQKSLLNLNSLQQQNPLMYGHALQSAAAAVAASFLSAGFGGGIDINAAAAANPTAVQQYAAAASLWPNIRAAPLQPAAQDWTQQQQQKAASIAHQLQLRLPVSLYQPQAQQSQQNQLAAATVGQARAASASSVTVASSLFGAPSAFSLPSQQPTAASVPPHSTTTNNLAATSAAAAAGLLVTAQPSQNQFSNISNASAAYSSCTSSNTANHPSMLGFRPSAGVTPLSRGASSSSLTPPTTSSTQLNIEQVAAKVATSNGWPNIGEGFPASSKVSPILAVAAAAAARGNGATSTPNDLQRIPEIASALAAAISAAQQQQQHQANNNDSTTSINIPISVATSSSRGTPSSISVTPSLQHSLAQRFSTPISSSNNLNNSTTPSINGGASNFSSSSGFSSAASSSLLQSPSAIPATRHQYEPMASTSKDSLSSPLSSLNSSGASSAFSTPAQQHQNNNITNLSTLTTALFAADKVVGGNKSTKDLQLPQNLLNRRLSGSRSCEGTNVAEGKNQQIPSTDNEPQNSLISLSDNSTTKAIVSSQPSSPQQKLNNNATTVDESKMTRLMECDSSVPSPPSKREDDDEREEDLDKKERRGEDIKKTDDENERMDTEAGEIFRKRHSTSTSLKSDGSSKPPAKHARKSNEVARLLNDLTAGNCSWQYMAERQQKSILKGKDKVSKEKVDKNVDKKKPPLRLDERKQLKINKNKRHKMLHQISDESSDESGDEKVVESGDESVDEHEEVASAVPPRRIDSDTGVEKKQIINKSATSDEISDLSLATYYLMNESECKRLSDADTDETKKIVKSVREKYGPEKKTEVDKDSEKEEDDEEDVSDNKVLQPPQPRKHQPVPPTKRTPAAPSKMAKVVKAKENKSVAATSTKVAGKKNAVEKNTTTTKTTAKDKEKPTATTTRGRKPKKQQEQEDNEEENDGNVVVTEKETKGRSRAVERAKDVGNKKERKATTTVKTTTTKKAKKKVSTSEDSDDNDNNTTFDEEADDSTVMEDWTGGEGDPELCQLASCKRPKDMKINWVACDGCDKWFHTICILGKNINLDDVAKWYCTNCKDDNINVDDVNEEVDDDEGDMSN